MGKKNLTEEVVKAHGIEVIDALLPSSTLPAGLVRELRSTLLCFSALIPKAQESALEFVKADHTSNIPIETHHYYSNENDNSKNSDFKKAQKLSLRAYELKEEEDALEDTWIEDISNDMFQELKDLHQPRRIGHLFDRLASVKRDVVFCKDTKKFLQCASDATRYAAQNMTYAKPDATFGFPIYSPKDLPPKSEFSSFYHCPEIRNFRLETLKKLRVRLQDGANHKAPKLFTPFSLERKMCFPWGIYEAKKDGCGDNVRAQIQRGAAICRAIMNGLAGTPAGGSECPPIVAFTSIGPVWDIYICDQQLLNDGRDGYFLYHIWNGNIVELWDALQLIRIIRNTRVWATRVVKPWVAMQIERHIKPPTTEYSEISGYQNSKTAPSVVSYKPTVDVKEEIYEEKITIKPIRRQSTFQSIRSSIKSVKRVYTNSSEKVKNRTVIQSVTDITKHEMTKKGGKAKYLIRNETWVSWKDIKDECEKKIVYDYHMGQEIKTLPWFLQGDRFRNKLKHPSRTAPA